MATILLILFQMVLFANRIVRLDLIIDENDYSDQRGIFIHFFIVAHCLLLYNLCVSKLLKLIMKTKERGSTDIMEQSKRISFDELIQHPEIIFRFL